MHRRHVLSVMGTVMITSGSGCFNSDNTDTGSKEANSKLTQTTSQSSSSDVTDTATKQQQRRYQLSVGETAYLSTGTVSITNPTVQGSIIYSSDISYSLLGSNEPTQQFVVVEIEGTLEVDPAAFALRRNGQVLDPDPVPQIVPVIRSCPTPCIGIPVDTQVTDNAAVVYHPFHATSDKSDTIDAAWNLDTDTLKLLGIQPHCQLQKARIIEFDGTVALKLTVKNVSPRDVGFRALIGPADIADAGEPIGFSIAKEQTVTKTIIPSNLQSYDPEEAAFTHPINEDTRLFTVGRKT